MTLEEWIIGNRHSTRTAAIFLGFTQAKLSHIRSGRTSPSLADCLQIEEKTRGKVKPKDFLDEVRERVII